MGSVHIRAFQSHHSFWFPAAALKGKTRLSTSLQDGGRFDRGGAPLWIPAKTVKATNWLDGLRRSSRGRGEEKTYDQFP